MKKSISIVTALMLSGLLIFTPVISKNADALYDGYSYMVTISINAPTNLINYQMKLTINKGIGANSAGIIYMNNHAMNYPYDIVFTKMDNITVLDCWRESYDINSITVWVEIDSAIELTVTNINLYYGKLGAIDSSNGDNTFIFFDDFLGSTINTEKWLGDTTYATVSNSIMSMCGSDSWKKIYSYMNDVQPSAMRMKTQFNSPVFLQAGYLSSTTTAAAAFYGDSKIRMYDENGNGDFIASNWNANLNTFDIKWSFTTTGFFQNDIQLTNSPRTEYCPLNNLPISFQAYYATASNITCDWVLMRNYIINEPTFGTPSIEIVPFIPPGETAISPMMGYLISIFAVLGFSIASSVIGRNGFSMSVFLTGVVIGLCILIWIPIIPIYMIILPIFIIIGILFSNGGILNRGTNMP